MSIEQPGYMARHEHHILSGGDLAGTGKSLLDVARDAGADFDVSYPEASYINPGTGAGVIPRVEKGKYRGQPQNVFVVRKDNGATVGLHSHKYPRTDGYKPVLRTAETLFPKCASTLTLFGKGEKVVFGQNIGKTVDLGGGDVLKPMLYWTSSLNGQWTTAVYNVMNRLFCQNQLIGMTPIISVRHTVNHDHLLDMRSQILGEQVKRAEVFAEMAHILKDQAYTDAQFRELAYNLVPDPEGDEPSSTALNNCARKRGAMSNAWRNERDEWGRNRWAAYNAVQGAEQHRILARGTGGRMDPNRSLQRTLDGKAQLADRAWELLLAA